MQYQCLMDLENLVGGKTNQVQFKPRDASRDDILKTLTLVLHRRFPRCITHGHFLDNDEDHLVYDLEVQHATFSCIKVIDFGHMLTVIREN